MCISVPARVIAVAGKACTVDVYSVRREVFLATESPVEVGDCVLIYGSIAIARIEPDEGERIMSVLAAMSD